MAESLAFRHAELLVKGYETEALKAKHDEAMECRDCEDFLQLGIDAFDWLMRADTTFRKQVYRREIEYDEKVDAAITRLLQLWQTPCEFAEAWAAKQMERGFDVDNLAKFRECCREVAGILTQDAEFFSGDALVRLRDDALDDHAKGMTVEYRAFAGRI